MMTPNEIKLLELMERAKDADAAVIHKIADRVVRQYTHPSTAEWARKWLSGDDRSEITARDTANATDAVVRHLEGPGMLGQGLLGWKESPEAASVALAAWAACTVATSAARGYGREVVQWAEFAAGQMGHAKVARDRETWATAVQTWEAFEGAELATLESELAEMEVVA